MYDTLWYDSLIKPFLQPPAWIFAPVWIILYAILFISVLLYTVTITKKKKISGYIYFVIHMIFNLSWSPIFFYLHKMNITFFIILIMIFTAILIIYKFFSVSKIAGAILLPYLCWLIFAAYLNLQLWRLNS